MIGIWYFIALFMLYAFASPIDNADIEGGITLANDGTELDHQHQLTARQGLQKQSQEAITEFFQTKDYSVALREHRAFLRKLSDEPLKYYQKFNSRLVQYGQEASFPEFEGVVASLSKAIYQNPKVMELAKKDEAFGLQCEILMHRLAAVQNKDRYYLPYRATIEAIYEAVVVLDIYTRLTSRQHMYYHHFRYRMYQDFLLNQAPEQIVIPIAGSVGARFFIKTRGVPLHFFNVVLKPSNADAFLNSPLDFWMHDVQHARRQFHETERYYDVHVKHALYDTQRSPLLIQNKFDFYKELSDYSIGIMKRVWESAADQGTKDVMKIILLDVFREQALVPVSSEICRSIMSESFIYPVERAMVNEENTHIVMMNKVFGDPSLLSSVKYKLRNGYYDSIINPNEKIVPKAYRINSRIAFAALQLLKIVGCEEASEENILRRLEELTAMQNNLDESNGVIDVEDDA